MTMSQRTAPRLWCARTLETEVNTMVAIDVAMAILTARSGGTPRADMMSVMKGTISMPPPMPSNPARKPVPSPSATNSTINKGSSSMATAVLGQGRGCLQGMRRVAGLNRGSGGRGQTEFGFI